MQRRARPSIDASSFRVRRSDVARRLLARPGDGCGAVKIG
jgi:hypothetical protein